MTLCWGASSVSLFIRYEKQCKNVNLIKMNCTITESYINKVNENYIVTLIIFWSDDYGLSVIKQNIDPFGLYWICSRTSRLTGFHHALPLLSSHNTRRMIPHSLNLPTHVKKTYRIYWRCCSFIDICTRNILVE